MNRFIKWQILIKIVCKGRELEQVLAGAGPFGSGAEIRGARYPDKMKQM